MKINVMIIISWLKKTAFVLLLLIFSKVALAQYSPNQAAKKGFDKENLFTGGELGFSLGNYTYINVSPLLGYRFSELFSAGVNINAQYNSLKYYYLSGQLDHKEHFGVYGGGVFGRVYPLPWLFLHIQPEYNFQRGQYIYSDHSQSFHASAPSLLIGAGYSQGTSGNSAYTIMLLYDVIQDQYSPYGNRVIFKAGVNIGL